MFAKKILRWIIVGCALICGNTVIAGGVTQQPTTFNNTLKNKIYVDLHLGYAQTNWNNTNVNGVMGAPGVSYFSPTSNGNGGFTVGADLGYYLTQHVGVEGGWFYLPQVSGAVTDFGHTNGNNPLNSTATINSGFAYLAAKLDISVLYNLDLFGKIGVAYRYLTYNVPAATSALNIAGNGSNWSPVFSTGIEYICKNWLLGMQYLYLPGSSHVNNAVGGFGAPNATPDSNLYTASLGYRFNA